MDPNCLLKYGDIARIAGTGPRRAGGRDARTLTATGCYGMYAGMAIMTHRTTFALDEATVVRIRRLAAQWKVSQAEVIRRVVADTEATVQPDPRAMLEALHSAGGGLSAAEAAGFLTAVREDRKSWRGT